MMSPLRLPVLLLAAALAWGGDAPTEAEWAPVAQLIAAGADDAVSATEALVGRYPRWIDGHRALATVQLRAGDPSAAWRAARAALALSRRDHAAAALGIQALAGISRFDDAFKVADLFDDAADPGGTVASQAAICALQAGDDDRLGKYLAAAKARIGAGDAATLDFITAKQAQRRGDLAAATAALDRAVKTRPEYRDALYEMGRILTVQALGAGDGADELLKRAEERFAAAARLDRRDAASRFGLGRARLERGKRQLAADRADEGAATLRTALTALDEGLQLEPSDRDAKLWKGDALLRLERYEEAVPLLRMALDFGASDRALPFNLSLALSRSGRAHEAGEVLAQVRAESADERLTMAMAVFAQGNWGAATRLFTAALNDMPVATPEQVAQRWAVVRFAGHAHRELAALAEAGSIEQEEHLGTAVNFYQEAGDNGDYESRGWYLHTQAPRSPMHAFVAGRQSAAWDGWMNPTAWKLLAGNYGYKVARGEGLPGVLKHGPAHLMLWVLLAIVPIGLFLKGWLLPHGLYGRPPGPRPATRTAAKPGAKSAAKPGTAAVRKPGAATTVRRPGAPPPKPPSRALSPKPKPGDGPKTPFSE